MVAKIPFLPQPAWRSTFTLFRVRGKRCSCLLLEEDSSHALMTPAPHLNLAQAAVWPGRDRGKGTGCWLGLRVLCCSQHHPRAIWRPGPCRKGVGCRHQREKLRPLPWLPSFSAHPTLGKVLRSRLAMRVRAGGQQVKPALASAATKPGIETVLAQDLLLWYFI